MKRSAPLHDCRWVEQGHLFEEVSVSESDGVKAFLRSTDVHTDNDRITRNAAHDGSILE